MSLCDPFIQQIFKDLFNKMVAEGVTSDMTLGQVVTICRGRPIIIWTGLNIKIGIVQKVYE